MISEGEVVYVHKIKNRGRITHQYTRVSMENQYTVETANRFYQLARKIVFRESPFEDFTWPEAVSNEVVEKYHLYKNEIDVSMKRGLEDYITLSLQDDFFDLHGFSVPEPSPEMHGDWGSVGEQFVEWYRNKEDTNYMPLVMMLFNPKPGFNVNNIIKETIQERYPESKMARKKPIHGVRTYYKTISDDNKLFMGFERGTLRTFMSFYIGFEKPWFGIDIGNFFLTSQSQFDYVYKKEWIGVVRGEKRRIIELQEPKPENVVEVTNTAIDLMESLLPHFLEIVG